ncbi:hypothetical protein SAMN05444365_107134 [Micromonospora pattaloongensis]|uniref:FtsK domain-containing protein n=1 Tax=Micromonospora pattaloongensis TaxID=405436 RepID=A0A1H3R7W0_9ACTN|nr:hypothetical protein [Micromonospora pattaloongensis]SDZ21922.1 hypothetical protein SAMN05444365_107134 [Micromonospora pattaloongensis]
MPQQPDSINLAQALLAQLGVRPEDLLAASTAPSVDVPTVAAFCKVIRANETAGMLRTYDLHWRRLCEALGAQAVTNVRTIDLLRQVLDLILARGPLVAAGAPLSLLLPVLLVCDELAELAAAGNAKQQDEARTLLRRITALGRKANVAVLLATQRTTATSIDVTTRSLLTWRVALAHPDDHHGSEAVLGQGRHHAAGLSGTDRGAAYVTAGGPPVLTRVFDLPRTAVPSLAVHGVPLPLHELREWDRVALRELRRA